MADRARNIPTLQELCIIELAKYSIRLTPTTYSNFIRTISTYGVDEKCVKETVLSYLTSHVCDECKDRHLYIYQKYERYPSIFSCIELVTKYPKNNYDLVQCIRCIYQCKVCDDGAILTSRQT